HGGHAPRGNAPADDSRSARSHRESDQPGPRGRPGADCGKGPREIPGHRRADSAVRRRRGGARGAGEAGDLEDIALTAAWVARAMDGEIVAGDPNHAFTGVSIDTRTLPAGALFFGIRGGRFDGADFAER